MSLKKLNWKETVNSVYGKMCVVFLTASTLSVLVFLVDNQKELPQNDKGESVVERNEYGKGNREEVYQVQIGELQETFTVEIQEQEYTDEELADVFKEAEAELQRMILGENESLDEVRSDLQLITEIPDTGIEVLWSLDNYKVMNVLGELKTENLTQEGTLVRLTALLAYGQEQCEYQFYVNIFAPKLSRSEQTLMDLEEEVQKRDSESRTDEEVALPSSVKGERVIWNYVSDYRGGGIFLMGAALSLFLYVSEKQKKKDADKNRREQLAHDYPQLINKFSLYIKAGMTVKNAWLRIAEDYERSKEQTGIREAYEEMVFTMQEMKSGTSERECYENFGERCRLPVYRKFGTMLSQNLKKGNKGMTDLLNQEAAATFEERKNMAKKLGEEASTKMMLPMFLMLGVVLVMIIVPAFITVQI
ncbi:MAG: type II secretion system F family protein [Schaedlerella sp.]|nr:type II secretion system F family protein [Schaedlerella sp.]